jgi:hypothetical protein
MEGQVVQLQVHWFQYFVNEQHEKVMSVLIDSNKQNSIDLLYLIKPNPTFFVMSVIWEFEFPTPSPFESNSSPENVRYTKNRIVFIHIYHLYLHIYLKRSREIS